MLGKVFSPRSKTARSLSSQNRRQYDDDEYSDDEYLRGTRWTADDDIHCSSSKFDHDPQPSSRAVSVDEKQISASTWTPPGDENNMNALNAVKNDKLASAEWPTDAASIQWGDGDTIAGWTTVASSKKGGREVPTGNHMNATRNPVINGASEWNSVESIVKSLTPSHADGDDDNNVSDRNGSSLEPTAPNNSASPTTSFDGNMSVSGTISTQSFDHAAIQAGVLADLSSPKQRITSHAMYAAKMRIQTDFAQQHGCPPSPQAQKKPASARSEATSRTNWSEDPYDVLEDLANTKNGAWSSPASTPNNSRMSCRSASSAPLHSPLTPRTSRTPTRSGQAPVTPTSTRSGRNDFRSSRKSSPGKLSSRSRSSTRKEKNVSRSASNSRSRSRSKSKERKPRSLKQTSSLTPTHHRSGLVASGGDTIFFERTNTIPPTSSVSTNTEEKQLVLKTYHQRSQSFPLPSPTSISSEVAGGGGAVQLLPSSVARAVRVQGGNTVGSVRHLSLKRSCLLSLGIRNTMGGNRASFVSALRGLDNLITLDISRNEIQSLKGLHVLPVLRDLCAHTNRIESLSHIVKEVCGMKCLRSIDLRRNPCNNHKEYSNVIILGLPQLSKFDEEKIDPSRKEMLKKSPPSEVQAILSRLESRKISSTELLNISSSSDDSSSDSSSDSEDSCFESSSSDSDISNNISGKSAIPSTKRPEHVLQRNENSSNLRPKSPRKVSFSADRVLAKPKLELKRRYTSKDADTSKAKGSSANNFHNDSEDEDIEWLNADLKHMSNMMTQFDGKVLTTGQWKGSHPNAIGFTQKVPARDKRVEEHYLNLQQEMKKGSNNESLPLVWKELERQRMLHEAEVAQLRGALIAASATPPPPPKPIHEVSIQAGKSLHEHLLDQEAGHQHLRLESIKDRKRMAKSHRGALEAVSMLREAHASITASNTHLLERLAEAKSAHERDALIWQENFYKVVEGATDIVRVVCEANGEKGNEAEIWKEKMMKDLSNTLANLKPT